MRAPHRLLAVVLAATVVAALTPEAGRAATTKRADLRVTAATTKTFTGVKGSVVRSGVSIRNVGQKKAGGSTAGLYLSRDSRADGADKRLATGAVPALAIGRTSAVTLQGRLPAAIAPGRWRVLACADVTRRVTERSEANNCLVWKTFTVDAPPPPPPPVEEGPLGGVPEVCGGERRAFSQGTTPPAGVHFTVSPTVDTYTVEHTADPVGFEAAYQDEYAHTRVTVTNDGTAAASILQIGMVVCEYDRTQPGYWGILYDDTSEVPPADQCPRGQLMPPGDSCVLDFYADRVTRGGSALAGAIEIQGQVAGQGGDIFAHFPVRTASRSRGFLQISPVEGGSLVDVPPGSRRYVTYEAVNTGDRDAVPTFVLDPATGPFDLGGETGWTTVGGVRKCDVSYSPGPPPTYLGALAPGNRCQFRISVCASQAGYTAEATLYGRDVFTSDPEVYSNVVELRYRTQGGEPGPACGG